MQTAIIVHKIPAGEAMAIERKKLIFHFAIKKTESVQFGHETYVTQCVVIHNELRWVTDNTEGD